MVIIIIIIIIIIITTKTYMQIYLNFYRGIKVASFLC